MDRDTEIMADHLPLEEVLISEIDGMDAPENWSRSDEDKTPELPPVLIEEDRGYSLVGNHRTVWHLKDSGRSLVKALVVRSSVHVRPAHALISNCTEEALLFEALLRREIVDNRSRLADMLGYSRARITQLLNLLKLPPEIRRKVLITDDISEFQLRQLLKVLDDEPKLMHGFRSLLEKKLSGRQMALFANTDHPPGEFTGGEEPKDDEPVEEVAEDSMTELEDVFAHTEEIPEKAMETEPAQEKRKKPEPPPVEERPDMAGILREIGSLRDSGWRARAAVYLLPPIQMEFLEGVSCLRTGLYARAMDILTDVVSEDSSHHEAWFYLGRCSNLTGSLQEAEEYLRNAVSRQPENPDYIVELAIVLEKLKRHTEAEAFYRKSAGIRKKLAMGK